VQFTYDVLVSILGFLRGCSDSGNGQSACGLPKRSAIRSEFGGRFQKSSRADMKLGKSGQQSVWWLELGSEDC
jgi:hypothetical protein